MTTARPCLTALLAAAFACQAHAQCEWEPSEHVSDHLTGVTYASLVWDRDGPGPLEPRLIAGGERWIGYVIEWDGRRWTEVGPEFPGPFTGQDSRVYVLAEYEGDLIAAGRFEGTTKPLNRIARFDGEEWTDMAGGFGPGPSGTDSFIRALAVYQGDLYAAGSFLSAGGTAASNVARWDGAAWHPLGAGTDYTARTLTVWDGKLVVGGEFREAGGQPAIRVATWDGESWGVLADAPLVPRFATVHDGDLYLASLDRVARWNGAGWDFVGATRRITLLASVAGRLMINAEIGGFYQNVGFWDGAAWVPLGDAPTAGEAWTLSEYQGDVVAMGNLQDIGEHRPSRGAGRWTGETWRPLGDAFNASFTDQVVYDSELIVVGPFTFGDGSPKRQIARWDGSQWLNFPVEPTSRPSVATIHDDRLVIAGRWVEQWDGAGWRSLGPEFDHLVETLHVHDGDLYAGGIFSFSGPTALNRVARWDGERWNAVGDGLLSTVYAFTSLNSELYAGGRILFSGGHNYLARWDGDLWHNVPTPFTDLIFALEVFEGDLIAGGRFDGKVARWDGDQWHAMGEGLGSGTLVAVDQLYVHDGALYACGDFTSPSGLRGVVRWDGAEWRPIAEGQIGRTDSLGFYRGDILADGPFATPEGFAPYAWARCATPCPADCDEDGDLTFFDFLCFQNQFAALDPRADCDGDGAHTFFDFLCFQNAFAAGCR